MPSPLQIMPMSLPKRSAGFTLVEIMVGMVIGLIGIIVMMNLFSNFEAQKRTTSGGSEVQNDGAISLFTIQRDIQQAGFGINTKDNAAHPLMFGCSVTVPVPPAPNPANPPAAFTLPAIAPVTINSGLIPAAGVAANTDTLLVVYGSGNGQPEGEIVSSLGASAVVATAFNTKFQPPTAVLNDQVIFEPVARPTPCNLSVDTVVGTNSTTLTLNAGMTSASIPIAPNNIGTMFNVGNAANGNMLKVIGYAVRGGNLTSCDYMQSDCSNVNNWQSISSNIVSLKAQYGRDNAAAGAMDGIVDVYDQATPAVASPTYACDWMRISSLRIALLGRNGQPDKSVVTAVAPLWAGSANDPFNLVGTIPGALDWMHYRYKVFETTIPLRNIALNGVISGC